MNLVISLIILLVFSVFIWVVFFKNSTTANADVIEESDMDKFQESVLCTLVLDEVDNILQMDYSTLNLNKFETVKNERNRSHLRISSRACSQGDLSAKMYMIDTVRNILETKGGINENTINYTITFDNFEQLTNRDKYDILLYIYTQKYGVDGLAEFIKRNNLDKPYGKGSDLHYEFSTDDLNLMFKRHEKWVNNLDYYDKLDILAHRIYSMTFGLGVICDTRDQNIDGLNCGTSGIPDSFYIRKEDMDDYRGTKGELPLMSYNAIWVMYKGKLIHFSCIGFGSQRELERVSKLIYRYDDPGTLDRSRGYIVNFMKDGSRVTVARPDMSESWVFHVRKFDTASKMPLHEMYPYKGNNKLITLLKWLVTGYRNLAITGEQGSGKSTLLGSLVQFLPASVGIRVQEMAFELRLRKIYPKRNIETFRETNTVSAQNGIEFIRKTDGTVGVFGEIAQTIVAALGIELGQVGLKQIIFTHHAKTAYDLVEWFRDAMIKESGFNNEEIVAKTVARVLNFNVHVRKSISGERYISRVTEIVPRSAEAYPAKLEDAQKQYYYRQTDRQIFDCVDILVFEDGEYVFKNMISDYSINEILDNLEDDDKVLFKAMLKGIEQELNERAVAERAVS